MRQWRVGTLSMGLLLVLTGLGLLVGQFYKLEVIDLSLKWWPVIFILLGIEVLAQNLFKKDENSRLQYDIFSIIIILFIVTAGLGLQTFSQLGLMEKARTAIAAQVFTLQDSHEIQLENGIQKIVLSTRGNAVDIHSSRESSITANTLLHIRARSKAEAEETAAQHPGISQQRVGDALYIQLESDRGLQSIADRSYTLIIPEQVGVEIDDADGTLNIELNSVQKDWQISGSGTCSINLPADTDLTVTALVNENALHGNLAWNQSSKGIDSGTAAENSDNQVQAVATLGDGTHKLNILGINDLTVNSLP